MASFDTETFLVDATDPGGLVEVLDEVAGAPGAWVNVEPDVDDSLRTEVSGLFAWFSARGAQVPVGTFVAGTSRDVPSIGVDHGSGRGAGARRRCRQAVTGARAARYCRLHYCPRYLARKP